MNAAHGNGRQPCCKLPCPFRAVAGLKRGQGCCPYHFTEYMHGRAWADQCYPDYATEAKAERAKTAR